MKTIREIDERLNEISAKILNIPQSDLSAAELGTYTARFLQVACVKLGQSTDEGLRWLELNPDIGMAMVTLAFRIGYASAIDGLNKERIAL
jgi:hypothetical protein